MRRTRASELVLVAAAVAVLVAVLLRFTYSTLPPMTYFAAVSLGVLAVLEFVFARRVRAAVRHDPRATPMPAITIARSVALGKASAVVGAGSIGAAVALVWRVFGNVGEVRTARSDFTVGLVTIVAAALLVAAGLYLEHAGVDPGNGKPDRTDNAPASGSEGAG